MGIKYTAECDLCLKQETSVSKEGFPQGWTSAMLVIADNDYPTKNRRTANFSICSTCYSHEFREPDMKNINNIPSSKLKDIFKTIWKKIS